MTLEDLRAELAGLADVERAKFLAGFFKTGKGEYAEGDRFLGITVPAQRKLAKRFRNLAMRDISSLLKSPIHEHRFTGIAILVEQYKGAEDDKREKIFNFYLQHAPRINNWDLVDASAPYIAGAYLSNRPREVLYRLAGSKNLWERRISIVATFAFLKAGETADTFRIAELLLSDKHDLIHKATGWALRETGRVSRPLLLAFLREHYSSTPRTTLRYAIEHLPAPQRKSILSGVFE